jgi:hypothetical protein
LGPERSPRASFIVRAQEDLDDVISRLPKPYRIMTPVRTPQLVDALFDRLLLPLIHHSVSCQPTKEFDDSSKVLFTSHDNIPIHDDVRRTIPPERTCPPAVRVVWIRNDESSLHPLKPRESALVHARLLEHAHELAPSANRMLRAHTIQ